MGKLGRVVVGGAKGVGKTAILQQLALCIDITEQEYEATLEDTYSVTVAGEPEKGVSTLVFHDTAGLSPDGPLDLRRPYLLLADAFLLVYDPHDQETFNRVDQLKKSLDRHSAKEKRDPPILVLSNNAHPSLPHVVDPVFANAWAQRERVKLYEVSAKERNSLVEPLLNLASRLFHPQKESKFTLPKRGKDKPGAAIVMDI